MDLLTAELKRKREELGKKAGSKYVKRGTANSILSGKDSKKQKKDDNVVDSNSNQNSATESKAVSNITTKGTDTSNSTKNNKKTISPATTPTTPPEESIPISNEEIIKRLRGRKEPIRLFAETDFGRYKRLHTLESREDRSGKDNEFKTKMEQAANSNTEELLLKKAGIVKETTADVLKDYVPEEDPEQINETLIQTEKEKVRRLIVRYLTTVNNEWAKYLKTSRTEAEKFSATGRFHTATQAQMSDHLKPFFKKLRKNTIEPDVLQHIAKLCMWMQNREYQKANDCYIRVAIGNSPWPIGVTSVGIHERSAREKLHCKDVAHVLNDEVQRKWIQAVKRLMTFAQTKWPPPDGSKLVG